MDKDKLAREQMQRERGICSVAICDQPIEGWCLTCTSLGKYAPKLCAMHLDRHCRQTAHIAFQPYNRNERINERFTYRRDGR